MGRSVTVRLNSGTDYKGVLACLDGYMNIAMEQTEEYVDGQLKAKYGDCFIRGNNGQLMLTLFIWNMEFVQSHSFLRVFLFSLSTIHFAFSIVHFSSKEEVIYHPS